MTPERTKELLPAIQAYAEGKEIECRHPPHGTWAVTRRPQWADNIDYRVKPEVACYRLWRYSDGYVIVCVTRPETDKKYYEYLYSDAKGRWITDWIPCPAINED